MEENKVKKVSGDDTAADMAVNEPAIKDTTEENTVKEADALSLPDEAVINGEAETDETKEAETSFEDMTVSELYALADSFGGENVIEDIGSEAFRIFAKGRSGNPEEIYSEFLMLKKTFNLPARGKSGQEKERANYGFDRYAPSKDPSVGLTRRQMELARSSGMSFREYEELLGSVPSGRRFGTKF